jgi:hypothetical protein
MPLIESPDRPEGLAIGTNIAVILEGVTKYFKIVNRDTIFYIDKHAPLPAGATERFAEVTALDPPVGQIYQFYSVMIEGNVKVWIKQPAAVNRWGTNRAPDGGYLTDTQSPLLGGQIINVWAYEDLPPNVQITNDTNVTIEPVLYWYGWRYSLEEIGEERAGIIVKGTKPAQFVPIAIGGISG